MYVKDSGQGCFITTAISEKNIIIFNHKRFKKPSEVTIIPANTINTFSNFVNIINGRLTPSIISSSTVAPITTTKKVEASTKMSTTAITDTTKTDAVETTYPSTEPTTQTSTVSTTVKPTTFETTVTSKATTAITDTDEISTAKSSATAKPTTPVISQATTVERVTTPTHEPITNSEETTYTVFTIPSTRTRELTTSASITTLPPQQTSSPHTVQYAITGPGAGIIAGSVLGAMGIVIGIIGFIVYKYVQKHRRYSAAPVLELSDLESHSNSSSGELFISNSRTSSPEIVLGSVSVESGSRSAVHRLKVV